MEARAEMCLVCVFDGLRPDMVRPDWTPRLWELRQHGAWFSRSHCVFPSVTRVNSAALSTGSYPGAHGLAGNTVWRPEVIPDRRLSTAEVDDLRRLRLHAGRAVLPATLGEVLAASGRRAVAVGTGSSGGTHLMHPEAGAAGGLVYHHQFSEPGDLTDKVAAALGPVPAEGDYVALALARVAYGARALTDVLIREAQPALASFWITLPDGAHHRFGLGAPEPVAAIRQVDAVFGDLLDRLATAGLVDTTDVIVTADHGYATVSGHVDVAAELIAAGLKRSVDSTDVVTCVDGGACLMYADETVDLERLSAFLLSRPWAGAVLARDPLPGTLPLAAAGCAGPHAPSLIAAMAWDDRANPHGIGGRSLGQGGIAVGAGDHGGISPFEMRNTLIAAGPSFRAGLESDVPCGIVDVAPTVLRCLGLQAPAGWGGRVLEEALIDGAGSPETAHERIVAQFAGGRQVLNVARVGGHSYVDSAECVRG